MTAYRRVTVALIMALAMSLGVECLAGPRVTGVQMPCCTGVGHDCGVVLPGADCCRMERAEHTHVTKPATPPAAAVTVLTSAPTALVRPEDLQLPLDTNAVPLSGSSTPKYILLATFLI